MGRREVFHYKASEFSTDVGANMFTIWWFEPYDLLFSSSFVAKAIAGIFIQYDVILLQM